MRYTFTSRLLIPAALLILGVLLGACEDDPILGPTDKEPSGGGSYGIIHFDATKGAPSGDTVSTRTFLNENPSRF